MPLLTSSLRSFLFFTSELYFCASLIAQSKKLANFIYLSALPVPELPSWHSAPQITAQTWLGFIWVLPSSLLGHLAVLFSFAVDSLKDTALLRSWNRVIFLYEPDSYSQITMQRILAISSSFLNCILHVLCGFSFAKSMFSLAQLIKIWPWTWGIKDESYTYVDMIFMLLYLLKKKICIVANI